MLENVVLQDWDGDAQVVVLEEPMALSQSYTLREKSSADRLAGYCYVSNSILYRCFVYDNRLVLSDGHKHVDLLDHAIRIHHIMDGLFIRRRALLIFRRFKLVFSVVYPPPVVPFDSTYDGLDAELDDFWLWFARSFASVAERRSWLEHWTKGS